MFIFVLKKNLINKNLSIVLNKKMATILVVTTKKSKNKNLKTQEMHYIYNSHILSVILILILDHWQSFSDVE